MEAESPRDIVANMLDWENAISATGVWTHYYIHFQTNTLGEKYDPPPNSYGFNSITTILLQGCLDTKFLAGISRRP